jgi:molybdate transport system regulatory protein
MASVSVRITIGPKGWIGPGKIDLLEGIAACGSIAKAGRKMSMSYRRAWELVEHVNGLFDSAVVERQVGGKNGGGATLTAFGYALVAHYRAIEAAARTAAQSHLDSLQRKVAPQAGAISDER